MNSPIIIFIIIYLCGCRENILENQNVTYFKSLLIENIKNMMLTSLILHCVTLSDPHHHHTCVVV